MSQQIQITGGAKVRDLQDVIIGTSGVLSSVAFDVANGVPRLDSNGKILVSQLPNSVMEYKGTWNAATNTPTLANGTGNQGDVYLCNVAGTVNFGAGPISFIVGDSAVYSGSIWQRSGGATGSVTSVGLSTNGGAITIGNSPISTSGTITANFNGTNLQYVNGAGNLTTFPTLITSIGLSMPSAFSVANSPLTANGTIAVTGAGVASQYIRGDGTLADFPSSGGGGSSVSYYLNGGTSQGTIGGVTYYEMSKTAVIGTGVDFAKSGDGFIVAFLTDANDPAQLNIPAGNWNYEIYASMSSNGGTPQLYAELYVYNGTTFTLISTSSNEILYDGTNLNLYSFAMTVPATTLALTDRLAIKLYATNSGGKTTTVHTQDSHLCQIITTFSTGITALNGLTAQVQYFQTGTSGTDFNISSTTATHTFNLPTASAANRGALSSADWSVFNAKQNAITLTTTGTSGAATLVGATLNIPQYQAAGTYVTSVTATAPLSSSGSTNPNITISQATTSTDGYLSSTDFNTFNNKISGSGTAGYITRYTGSGSTIGNSGLYDDGTTVSLISRALSGSSASFGSSVTATSFVKTGGTSAQFLKADGSVDSSTYLTTSAAASTYQTILTNPVTGTGTTNYLPKFTGTSSIANSIIYDNSGNVLINTTDASIGHRLAVYSASEAAQVRVMGGAPSVLFTNTDNASFIYSGYLGIATSVNNFVTGTSIGDYVMANNSNFSLVFATNGSIKMKMFANGNLAVGTTTDSGYKLDVNGTGRFSGNVGIGGASLTSLWQGQFLQVSSDLILGRLTVNGYSYWGHNVAFNGSAFKSINGGSGALIGLSGAGGFNIDFASGAAAAGDTYPTYATKFALTNAGAATFSSSVTAASYYGQTLTTSSQYAINLNNSIDNQICLAGNARMTVVDYTATKYLFTITPTGNVGIGTTSPTYPLTVVSNSSTQGFRLAGRSSDNIANMSFTSNDQATEYAFMNTAATYLAIGTNGSERMRITSAGNVFINATSGGNERFNVTQSGANWAQAINHTNSTQFFMDLRYNGTQIGSIIGNGTTTTYNVTSDYRLKQDLKDYKGLELVSAIRTYDYEWKSDKSRMYGVIAHELKEVIPYAVFGEKDAEQMQQVDYSKIVPVLVKAIQEQQKQIEELKQLIK